VEGEKTINPEFHRGVAEDQATTDAGKRSKGPPIGTSWERPSEKKKEMRKERKKGLIELLEAHLRVCGERVWFL